MDSRVIFKCGCTLRLNLPPTLVAPLVVLFGAVHKIRLQSGGRGFVQCEQGGREGGFFRCGRPHFWRQITSDFSKFMTCPHGQGGRGVELMRTFCCQGEGVNFFSILCGRLLWTAPFTNPIFPSIFVQIAFSYV